MLQKHNIWCNVNILLTANSTRVSSVRSAGTAAINMCLVASGCVEAYYEIGIHVWDIAAGSLIVSEAGGVLMDVDGKAAATASQCCPDGSAAEGNSLYLCSGEAVDLMSRRIVAANSRTIAERIVKEIRSFRPPRDDAPPPQQ